MHWQTVSLTQSEQCDSTKLTNRSLAMVEMKTLLRRIYAQYRTTIAAEMRGDMSIHDQIIASRPKDQTCLLVFDRVETSH